MLLLAIDTSTPAVTAAVHDGTAVLADSTVLGVRRHGELLAPAIADVLARADRAPADLTCVVAGVGPGPFTGLRVGLATALAFRTALGIPAYGICSLDALAWCAPVEGEFVVVTDALRREVYWAEYVDRAHRRPGTVAAVSTPATVTAISGDRPLVGPGARLVAAVASEDGLVPDTSSHHRSDETPLSAAAMAELAVARIASGGELLEPFPLYLRRPDATSPGPRKRVLA